MITLVKYRFAKRGESINSIILDNCCHWGAFLHDIFGFNINIKLDVFHAVQRITRTLTRKDHYYHSIINELRMVFRMPGDVGKRRCMSTPNPEQLRENLEVFVDRWKKLVSLRDTTLKELDNIKKHVVKGCLSDIPPGIGTNRNEALHKHLNPYFHKSRLGVHAAYALLCLLFYIHNKKVSDSSDSSPVVPSNAQSIAHDHSYLRNEHFGIVGKNRHPLEQKFWGMSSLQTFEESLSKIDVIGDYCIQGDAIDIF